MNLKSLTCICIILASCFWSCAQLKYGVVSTRSYYAEVVPGTIAVDDDGQPINRLDTVYNIYIETRNPATPVWKKAWVHGSEFRVEGTVMASPLIAGIHAETGEPVTLATKPGNQLIQLNLKRTGRSGVTGSGKMNTGRKVLLEGDHKGKKVFMEAPLPVLVRKEELQ